MHDVCVFDVITFEFVNRIVACSAMLMITFQNRFGDKPNNNETVPPHLGQLFFIFRTVYFWFTFNVVNKKRDME